MAARQAVEPEPGTGSAHSKQRFDLLLLDDGEYYFRDYTCYFWRDSTRIFGHLKVCSMGLFFVPRDVKEPIFRVPYKKNNID